MPDEEEDDFGDFGDASTSVQKSLENGTSNSDDDELIGPDSAQPEVGSVTEYTSNDPVLGETDAVEQESAQPAQAGDNRAKETSDILAGTQVDEDDFFGDFGSPQQPAEPAVAQDLVNSFDGGEMKGDDNDQDDFFGGFSISQQPAEAQDFASNASGDEGEIQGNGNDDLNLFCDSAQKPEEQQGSILEPVTAPLSTSVDQEFGNSREGEDYPIKIGESNERSDADGNDADFGDFEEGQQIETQPADPTVAASHIQDEYDDFGDFGTAPQLAETQTADPAVTTSADGDDNFCDLGTASRLPEPQKDEAAPATEADADDDDDDFGDFGTAPQQAQTQTGAPAVATEADAVGDDANDDDDDFGDFGSALQQPETQTDVPTDYTQADTINDDDASGNFGTVPQQAETVIAVAADNNEDAFSDFGAAAQSEQSDQPDPVNETVLDSLGSGQPAGSEKAEPAAVADGDEDDFGDFGAAPQSEQSDPPLPLNDTSLSVADNPDSAQPPGTQNLQTADDDDEFSDFDSAPEPIINVDSGQTLGSEKVEPAAGANDEDDDFSDFGDFDSAPQSQQPDVQPAPSNDTDFGDFDSAHAGPVGSNDNDDFGDFGTATGTAPATQQTAGFAANFANESADPILQKARRLCAKVFERHAADPDDTGTTDSSENETIESLLSSIEKSKVTEGERDSPKKLLMAILNDTTTLVKSPSTIIVASDDDSNTNAHFSVPVGGGGNESAFLAEEASGRRQVRGPGGVSSYDKPPVSSPPDTLIQPNKTALGPPFKSSREILQQIPDLSFMLESKLVPPKTKN